MREIRKLPPLTTQAIRRKRVAAYARVSSGKDAMLQSLSAQISYYNRYIGQRGDWEFAGVYADEPVTGTKDKRPEFQRLLTDCRARKIDMVITKSITRLARNTVILLETVRELKLLNVDVFFEKESIHSLSGDGELMLTLLASYAQEESRSVSENQKWRIRRMFAEGRPNTGNMLGYRLIDGQLQIVPEEAETVRQIFTDYLSGLGRNAIIKKLNSTSTPTRYGGIWRESVIYSILRNEKYTGDMLLQKTFIADHISKKKQMNRGELPMYQVINSHEAIIDKESFALVQVEIEQRANKYRTKNNTPSNYPFSGMLRCGLCGKYYRRKIAAAGSKYAKPVWICGTFNTYGKNACASQQIPENILMQKTMEALNVTEIGEGILKRQLVEIQVAGHNQLIYVFKDGYTVEADWQNPSRRESWDQEMRQVARERQSSIVEKRQKNE